MYTMRKKRNSNVFGRGWDDENVKEGLVSGKMNEYRQHRRIGSGGKNEDHKSREHSTSNESLTVKTVISNNANTPEASERVVEDDG